MMIGKRPAPLLVFIVFVIIAQLAENNHVVQADILCYACSSYMSQCQPESLVSDVRNVFKARCSGKCFIRQGEDNATYRGCFDGFSSVVDLTDGYIGCRSQTWNNRQRQWCLCNTDLCNVHFDLQSPPSPSQHQRHLSPLGNAHGNNGAPPPSSFGRQIPSKHQVRPSQDPQSEFFESFAGKAKYRQSAPDAPSSLNPYVIPRLRSNEDGGRNLTNRDDERPLDHFKEQDDRDVLIEEPIAFNHVLQDKRDNDDDDRMSRGSLPLPRQTKKEEAVEKKSEEDSRPSKGVSQITYDADILSLESVDYPYNQAMYRSVTTSPQRVSSVIDAIEDDLDHGRKLDSVQADGPERQPLQDNDPTTTTTRKVAEGRRGNDDDHGRELKTGEETDLKEKNPTDDELDSEFTDDVVEPELSEDYPYNQIFNEELDKEDLERMTEPRLLELRFNRAPEPPRESAQKPESSKSSLEEGRNSNSKEEGPRESANRLRENAESSRKEFPSSNQLFRAGSFDGKQQNRPQPNQEGLDARARLAIRDADILWVGQDRATDDDTELNHFTIPKNFERKENSLERGRVDSELEKGRPYRQHHMELEGKKTGEVEDARNGKEADINDAQNFNQAEQEAKNLERIGADRRTGVREQQNEEEELSSKTIQVEQTTTKAATTIRCFRTGYYDNPTDCTQFIACLLDPRSRAYILHFMRCPAGLSWDNSRKLCMQSSSTCSHSNNRNHGNGARVSPDAGIQLTQKHLVLANGGEAL